MWQTEHRIETSATPTAIWALLRDVSGWTQWNAGIERIELHGPFAAGTEFTMTPPGQEPLLSKLTDVRENELFINETTAGDISVIVEHRIEKIASSKTLVRYLIRVIGPEAEDVGKAISADFPDVLRALVDLAEAKRAA